MLNSEYKLSRSSVNSQQPAKSYQKQPNNYGIHCPILILVPSETLTAITSNLDPPALSALAGVNIYLNGHVKDDNTWRRALFYQFLSIGPENDLDGNKALLLRRTESSWRNEFTFRYKLKRRWERSRNAIITHIPVNSPISSMHIMSSHALLTSSIQYGIIARSLPLTGKVLPGYLDTSGGARVGLGIGNPNAEFTPNISACAVSSDGGTAKIVWGTRAGDVLFMNAPRAMDGGRRTAADVRKCDIADEHGGSVLDAQWVAGIPSAAPGWAVITAGADGKVKLWDAKTAVCQWTSQRKTDAGIPDPYLKLTATQTGTHGGCIAAVTKSGEIHIWTGFALGSVIIYPETSIKETIIGCPISTHRYDPQAAPAVIALHIDPNPNSASPTVLVAYENHPFFYRIQTPIFPEQNTDIATFGDPFFGSISVVVPYFRGRAEQQASLILAGDHLGWVSLYAWDTDNSSLCVSSSILTPTSISSNNSIIPLATIQPIHKFEAHPDSTSITALTWSPHTLITGSARGTTHVFDALSFEHLRSFAPPIPKTRERHQGGGGDEAATERDRQKVKQIIVGGGGPDTASTGISKDKGSLTEEDRDLVVISVGERVMAWKAGPVPKYKYGSVRARRAHGALGAGRRKRLGHARYLQQLEVNQTILESRHDHQLLLDESKYKSSSFGSSEYVREREREQKERLEHLGLSEVEAVEYVLMLSRDEANANAKTEGGSEASASKAPLEAQDIFEGDFDTEQNIDNDAEDDNNRSLIHSTVSSRRWPSTSSTAWSSLQSSPLSSSASLSSRPSHSNLTSILRTTTTGSTTIATRHSTPRLIPSSSNEKIQVSPSFIPEPMEAGQEWLVDYNVVKSDSGSISGDANRDGMEAHMFPPIIPGGNAREKEKHGLKGQKRDRKDNIQDTPDVNLQGWEKAVNLSPSLSSRHTSDTDVGIDLTVNQNTLTSSSPSPLSTSTSSGNVPLPTGQTHGQGRGLNTSNPSSASTFPSVSVSIARNAWASGGPRLSARISPPTVTAAAFLQSHHHRYQQQQGRRVATGTNSNADMEEDLKFAIELSLVEARSRGEDV